MPNISALPGGVPAELKDYHWVTITQPSDTSPTGYKQRNYPIANLLALLGVVSGSGSAGVSLRVYDGVPPAAFGSNGDSAVNVNATSGTGDVYTKANGAWTKVPNVTLRGPAGTNGVGTPGVNGQAGVSHRVYNGVPPASFGVDGDSCVNTNATAGTGDVYNKVSGAWVKDATATLRGPAGAKGDPGTPGTAPTTSALSDLTLLTTLTDSMELPIGDAGTLKRTTLATLKAFLGSTTAATPVKTITVSAPSGVSAGDAYGTSGTLSGFTTDPVLSAYVDGAAVTTGVAFTLTGSAGASRNAGYLRAERNRFHDQLPQVSILSDLNLDSEAQAEIQQITDEHLEEMSQREDAESKLHSALAGIRTRKQFIEHFPELEKYAPEELTPDRTVPAISNVMATLSKLGFPADKNKAVTA